MKAARVTLVVALLAWGFFVQAWFLLNHRQPILFGDPGAYYIAGQQFQEAFQHIYSGEGLPAAFDAVRDYLLLSGVGILYAAIDSVRPGDIPYFRLVLAGFNSVGMLGAFLLARRISGSFAGGVVALGLATVYPSFALQTGRIFPEPVVGCLFVGSTLFYLEGVDRSRALWMAAAGFTLGAGLFLRAQLMTPLVVLLVVALAATAPFWARLRERRRLVAGLALGLTPFLLLWAIIVRATGTETTKIDEFGLFALSQQRYPYGFWMYLDADGWIGPYSLGSYPFWKEMESAAEERDPELLRSRLRQYQFVLRYLAARPSRAVLQVLENVYRLHERPANDYQWDYLFSTRWQTRYQKALAVLGMVGVALFLSRRPARLGVLFLPASMAVVFGLSFVIPRYNQPVALIWIALAGATLGWAAPHLFLLLRGPREGWIAPGILGASGLACWLLAAAMRMPQPAGSRWLTLLGTWLLLGALFLAAARLHRVRQHGVNAAFLMGLGVLVLLTGVRAARDSRWHETELEVGKEVTGVEQEILLSAESLARLRAASQLFLVFDVRASSGSLDRVQMEVNGRSFSGRDLVPTIQRIGESTVTVGRDGRRLVQWWALPLELDVLPENAPAAFRVRLIAKDNPAFTLFGDRFAEQGRIYEGPSFGDWPYLAEVKFWFHGDNRLDRRLPLRSQGTRSSVLAADGSWLEVAYAHRIRIVSLAQNEGGIAWESPPLPSSDEVGLGVFAYSGRHGSAEWLLEGEPLLTIPLGSETDFDIEAPPYRVCYRASEPRGGMAYGGYVLFLPGPEEAASSRHFAVRYRSGMSLERLFWSPDPRRSAEDVESLAQRCGGAAVPVLPAVERIVDASKSGYPDDTGFWTVRDVF